MSTADYPIEDDKNTFSDIAAGVINRRRFLQGGLATVTTLSILDSLAVQISSASIPRNALLGFEGVAVSSADAVIVPVGYSARVLIAWGDPVSNGPAFLHDASNTAAEQAQQWGMNNDGLAYFPIEGSQRGLLVQNNEFVDDGLLFADGRANWSPAKTDKSLAAHGVSIVEIERNGQWQVVRPSKYARRITGTTPIRIGGPAAGDPRLITSADPTGRLVLGTLQNCAIGQTPWKTFLTCEENFDDYFRTASLPPGGSIEARYGLSPKGEGYLLHTTEKRFRVAEEPNEPNRFGWVVEIDPFQPGSVPVKRTALGRMKHENACVQEARDGRVVVLMGDDEQFEYIYRYVSKLRWRDALKRGVSPLDEGVLYVAKFNSDETGHWIPLTPDNPALASWSLNDTLINTRGAADAVGATKMDRPEWIDAFPNRLTAIATLTNNTKRGVGTQPAPDKINPRSPNLFGHVITWSHHHDWTDNEFRWDIFALCGDPTNPAHKSSIVGDKYGSPDTIYVAPSGRLWILTDVAKETINEGNYAGFGNNQMLCVDPSTRETRRFLVGPNKCEITGVRVTPDETTMFVGIQHPGESPAGPNDPKDPKRYSSWPDGSTGGRPRSACIVITRNDGGIVGT